MQRFLKKNNQYPQLSITIFRFHLYICAFLTNREVKMAGYSSRLIKKQKKREKENEAKIQPLDLALGQ